MLGEAVKVLLLLLELLLQLEELLALTLADSVILASALAALEGITVEECKDVVSLIVDSMIFFCNFFFLG